VPCDTNDSAAPRYGIASGSRPGPGGRVIQRTAASATKAKPDGRTRDGMRTALLKLHPGPTHDRPGAGAALSFLPARAARRSIGASRAASRTTITAPYSLGRVTSAFCDQVKWTMPASAVT